MPHRRGDCEGSRHPVLTAPPLTPKQEALEAFPRELYNSPLHAPTHMLTCYQAVYFYERPSSTNALIEERCDRCDIRHQIFPVLVTIRFLVSLCSFKIENVLSVLVL